MLNTKKRKNIAAVAWIEPATYRIADWLHSS